MVAAEAIKSVQIVDEVSSCYPQKLCSIELLGNWISKFWSTIPGIYMLGLLWASGHNIFISQPIHHLVLYAFLFEDTLFNVCLVKLLTVNSANGTITRALPSTWILTIRHITTPPAPKNTGWHFNTMGGGHFKQWNQQQKQKLQWLKAWEMTWQRKVSPCWTTVGNLIQSDSHFWLHCACQQVHTKALWVLIWR